MNSTEEDMTKRAQIRASFAAILEKARLGAVEGASASSSSTISAS